MIYNDYIRENFFLSNQRSKVKIPPPPPRPVPLQKPQHMTLSTRDFLTRLEPLWQVQ